MIRELKVSLEELVQEVSVVKLDHLVRKVQEDQMDSLVHQD